ncbi:MAG: hypothetical protein NT045_01820 [Candidatus Aureabacteria bacterium]|nr:hypothetical protein [Candidatus Auribacterota bacterium]
MTKAGLLRIVNPVLFLSLVIQAVTAGIIFLRLRTVFTPTVFEIHEPNGVLFVAQALTHLTLNWGWVRANYFKR